jgi:predicted nucleotidyltransferase
MESLNQPTPYPEVNLVLKELLTSVQSILGGHFIGMYLYGSLATGDFDRDSDVDYLVVTDDVLSGDLFSALQNMHTRIATLDSWCATQLEGSYVPQSALRRYDPLRALHLHIDRGRGEQLKQMNINDASLSRAWWGGWVLLRDNLLEKGIMLAGPALKTLLDPVPSNDLREAMIALLHGWVTPILDHPGEMDTCGYQSYTVLTLCRILYTLHLGAVESKPVAARWAQETLDQRWVPLIDRAWVGRQNPGLKAQAEDVNETLDFIRYTLERSQQFETPADKVATQRVAEKTVRIDRAEEILKTWGN